MRLTVALVLADEDGTSLIVADSPSGEESGLRVEMETPDGRTALTLDEDEAERLRDWLSMWLGDE